MSLLEWLKFWSKFYRIPPILKYSFRIPPPQNENCQRAQVREFQNTPPPNWNLGRSWHFKTFQFQNIWYQWETMCGKLLHVETLSSPDNYSFTLWRQQQFLVSKMPVLWRPPFGATIPICDVNIWRHQSNGSYSIAVAVDLLSLQIVSHGHNTGFPLHLENHEK